VGDDPRPSGERCNEDLTEQVIVAELGMAPAARIAVYKICWNDTANNGGCVNSDTVAAIDAAVGDGVDVLNFSVSGSLVTVYDPVEIAFYNAAKAGVFVAASAGNSGPAQSTVAHYSPWLTTVAAGTKDRSPVKTVTLGNGASYTGVGQGGSVPAVLRGAGFQTVAVPALLRQGRRRGSRAARSSRSPPPRLAP